MILVFVFMYRNGKLRECLYFSHANLTYLISLLYIKTLLSGR